GLEAGQLDGIQAHDAGRWRSAANGRMRTWGNNREARNDTARHPCSRMESGPRGAVSNVKNGLRGRPAPRCHPCTPPPGAGPAPPA
ncbi:hypothetical protein CN601_22205, partial [Bacillus sp. AFS017336]